ncbi:MAG: hypothetical protein AAFZ63_21315 [Bacteroidota bacterium]
MIEEPTIEAPSIELDKASLLNGLTDPDAVNFFDLDFIELTNPHLSGEVVGHELTGVAESVYLDFLIKNGELNYVPDLIPEFGYPMWHRMEISQGTSPETEAVLIPFVDLENGKTNALMIAIPSNDDLFYQEHNLDRSGYYYLTMTREELAAELENLDQANDNTYAFLFHFLYFDESVFDHREEAWWEIWEDHDGLVSGGDQDGSYYLGGQVGFRDLCSSVSVLCLPYAIISGEGPSGTLGNSEVEFRDCYAVIVVYQWECPGSSGGYIPGGGTTTSGGGSGNGSGTSVSLDQIIADCSSLLSVDVEVQNPPYGEGECAALLAAIENLGYNALPPAMWLALFERGGALLDEAGSISSETDMVAYNLYLTYTLSGRTTQPFRIFNSNYRRVQELQTILEFDEATFEWLLDDATSLDVGETSVADEIKAFLEEYDDPDFQVQAEMAANIGLQAVRAGVLEELDSPVNTSIWAQYDYCIAIQ